MRITSSQLMAQRTGPLCMESARVGLHMMLDRAKELEWRPFKEVESHEVCAVNGGGSLEEGNATRRV